MKEVKHRVMQTVFETHTFYGYGKPRFEHILLHAAWKKYGDMRKSGIWFRKIPGIQKITHDDLQRQGTNGFVDHNVEACQLCGDKKAKDYVFVIQRYTL